MKLILSFAFLLFALSAGNAGYSQYTKATTNEKEIIWAGPASGSGVFTYVEQMPKAGYDFDNYMNEHLRYPDAAREHHMEGRVIVKFIVNEDGAISDVTVNR